MQKKLPKGEREQNVDYAAKWKHMSPVVKAKYRPRSSSSESDSSLSDEINGNLHGLAAYAEKLADDMRA